MIGKVIKNNYRIIDEIGRGSVATVYLAKDLTQNRMVTLKIIHPEQAVEGQFLQRFQQEAKLLQMLSSPQAVKVFDYGEDEGLDFIVLEYVQGKTLASILEEEGLALSAVEGPLGVNRALDIAKQVALCLVDAHAKSIVHQDLRPANIMVTAERIVKVMDFGISEGVGLSQLMTTGVLGSPHYLSPEQAEGKVVDSRSDLYSLGVILFEMLSGRRPYDADSAADIVLALMHEPVPSLHQLDGNIPLEVDKLVRKCLAKKPEDRYQSAAEFLEAIDETLRAMAAKARGSSPGMEAALAGQTLGPYRLIKRTGRGGMATVYKAYEPGLDRYVAIKVLPQYFAHDPDFQARFLREAKAIARLNHPNILPVYGSGQQGDVNYIVMRYVEAGATLKDLLGQPLELGRAVEIFSQVGRALDYAHRQGVVHRDVKPTNVLMAEGEWALLMDFGLARMVESSVQLTKTGVGVGTPAYMSPEQGQGTKVDARSDVYSLGVMLYEMLTGKVPYEAGTPMAVVIKHITAPLPMPCQANPEVPETVERVILKAMAKAPDDRYQTAGEMVEALGSAVAGVPIKAPPVPTKAPPESVSPPTVAQPPVAAFPTVARKVLVWLLRIAGIVLVVLFTVVAILLLLGSFGAATLIERAIAGGARWEAKPGSEVTIAEAAVEKNVVEVVRLYPPGIIEDVSLDLAPPDRIDVQGTVFGKEMTLECTLTSADGMIDFEIERLGGVRLYLVGNILSGGVNRGLKTVLEERSLTVEGLKVGEKILTIKHGGVMPTTPPTSTATRSRQTPMSTATRLLRTPTATSAYEVYVVQEGDSLSKIAKRFGVTVEDLIKANKARYPSLVTDRGTIEIGWKLRIPKR